MIKKGKDDIIPSATEDEKAEKKKEAPPDPEPTGERSIKDPPKGK